MKGIAEFEAAVAAANLPGAVALITDSKETRYAKAFGMADAVNGVPMREDSLFQIASMTKALTSAAVLQLVERGKLGGAQADALMARIEAAPDDSCLARCGAVAGQDFSIELATDVLGVPVLDLADAWVVFAVAFVTLLGAAR